MTISGTFDSPPQYVNELPPEITENSSDIVNNVLQKLSSINSQSTILNFRLNQIVGAGSGTTYFGYE